MRLLLALNIIGAAAAVLTPVVVARLTILLYPVMATLCRATMRQPRPTSSKPVARLLGLGLDVDPRALQIDSIRGSNDEGQNLAGHLSPPGLMA